MPRTCFRGSPRVYTQNMRAKSFTLDPTLSEAVRCDPADAASILVGSDRASYNDCDIKSERFALRQPGLAATVPK
jgi:hypothetical protein